MCTVRGSFGASQGTTFCVARDDFRVDTRTRWSTRGLEIRLEESYLESTRGFENQLLDLRFDSSIFSWSLLEDAVVNSRTWYSTPTF